MKKTLYIYPKGFDFEQIDAINYNYKYVTISGFVKRCNNCPHLNIVDIKSIETPIRYLDSCTDTGYRLEFYYRWKERNLFKSELVKVLADDYVAKYYIIE